MTLLILGIMILVSFVIGHNFTAAYLSGSLKQQVFNHISLALALIVCYFIGRIGV